MRRATVDDVDGVWTASTPASKLAPMVARDADTLPVGQAAAVGAPVLAAGTVLAGRFRIVRLIARGGMGAVYVARDLELDVDLALKTVRAEIAGDPAALARFKREVQLARAVTDPAVCRTFDLWQHGGGDAAVAFMTMELIGGETLAARLRRGPVGARDALPIVEQICRGLDAVHAAGVVHRDLKPANVMLDGNRVVLTDFGIAEPHAAATATAGTPGYMPPEARAGGTATATGDIYALGALMFEMLTGRLPVDRAERAALPRRWARVIERCLADDPGARPARAGDVAAALRGRKTWPQIAGAGELVVGAVAIAAIAWPGAPSREAPVARLAVHELVAQGGADPVVGRLLDERLAARLESGDEMRVVARDAPDRIGDVAGTYRIDGARVAVELRVVDREGTEVAVVRDTAIDLSALVDTRALRLRGELALDGLIAGPSPIAEAALPDAFARGIALLDADRPAAARAALAEAVAAAPGSARALAELSAADLALGFRTRARNEALEAAALAGALPATERLRVAVRVREALDDWKGAADAYGELVAAAPGELALVLRRATALARAGDVPAARRVLAGLPAAWAQHPRVDLLLAQHADTATESEAAARRALASALERGDARTAGWAEMRIADAQMRGGALAAAEATLASAAVRFAAEDDREGLARVQFQRAGVVWRSGELDRAGALLAEPLVLYRALGHRAGEAAVLSGQGVLASTSDPTAALRRLSEAIAIHREIGDVEGELNGLLSLGVARYHQGDVAGAAADWRALQERAVRGPQDLYVAIAEVNLAEVAELGGDLAGAVARYGRAREMFSVIGEASGVAFAETGLGLCALAAGDRAGALPYLAGVTARRELAAAVAGVAADLGAATRARIHAGAAEVHAALGDRRAARDAADRAAAEARRDRTIIPRLYAAIAGLRAGLIIPDRRRPRREPRRPRPRRRPRRSRRPRRPGRRDRRRPRRSRARGRAPRRPRRRRSPTRRRARGHRPRPRPPAPRALIVSRGGRGGEASCRGRCDRCRGARRRGSCCRRWRRARR